MCIGIPMRVIDSGSSRAGCEGRGERIELDMLLVGPQPSGTWVLAFNGVARRVLSQQEAVQISDALDALEAVSAGVTDIDRFFVDLIDREPELPEHLRRQSG